jgi:hypothetical protein
MLLLQLFNMNQIKRALQGLFDIIEKNEFKLRLGLSRHFF